MFNLCQLCRKDVLYDELVRHCCLFVNKVQCCFDKVDRFFDIVAGADGLHSSIILLSPSFLCPAAFQSIFLIFRGSMPPVLAPSVMACKVPRMSICARTGQVVDL